MTTPLKVGDEVRLYPGTAEETLKFVTEYEVRRGEVVAFFNGKVVVDVYLPVKREWRAVFFWPHQVVKQRRKPE